MPLTDFSSEPAWHRVGWIPFSRRQSKPPTILANTVLYVPLGILRPGDRSRIRSFFYAIAAGAAVSMIGETTQLSNLSRFPALTDVACNAMGTALGTWSCY